MRAFRALLLPLTLCGSLAGCYYWDSGAGPGYTYGLPPSPSSGSFYDSGRSLAPNYGNDSSPGPSQGYDYYGNGCPSGSGSDHAAHLREASEALGAADQKLGKRHRPVGGVVRDVTDDVSEVTSSRR